MGKNLFLFLLSMLIISVNPAYANDAILFSGLPSIRIVEAGVERNIANLNNNQSKEYRCIITERNGKYFWKSRENIELISQHSGAFITYNALNGSGYIRIIPHEFKKTASLMGKTEDKYDYVEHILLGLRSYTYYGKQYDIK